MSVKKLTFEQQIQRLEEIVAALERGDAHLDESLKLFREGTELVRSCGKMLEDARLQVNLVTVDGAGQPVMEAFDHGCDA